MNDKSTKKAIGHLSKDPRLRKILSGAPPLPYRKETDLYLSLLRAIAGQQLSVKAAETIWQRFLNLFPEKYPHPPQLMELKDETLRTAGLSFQKAGYLKNIARFRTEHDMSTETFLSLDDEAVIARLCTIKGVGRWTAEMLLIFSLGRPDVFPIDDLGIQQGMMHIYKIRPGNKKMLIERMKRIAEPWRPYRSWACLYIWHYKDSLREKSNAKKTKKSKENTIKAAVKKR